MTNARHTTSIWLAAVCLLLQAYDLSAQSVCTLPTILQAPATHRATTCESSGLVHRLTCENGVISIQSGLYGRADRETCSEGRPANQLSNTQCSQSGAVDVMKSWCNGKKTCELNTDVFRTSDPCQGTFKYVDTRYICVPANQAVACEGAVTNLQCGDGQVIFVYGAEYGRRDQTTCIFRRPNQQITNTICPRNPVDRHTCIVAERCNGKSSCSISARNSVFGDPCGGIYKYLQVSYVCEFPLTTSEQMSTGSQESEP